MWYGQVQPDEVHCLGAGDRLAELLRSDIERQVTPIQSELGNAGILQGGRGGMTDRMAVHRAIAGAGIDRQAQRLGHAVVIGKSMPSAKSIVRGVNQQTVKQLVGHASDRINDAYTHIGQETLDSAAKPLPDIITVKAA